MTVARTWYRWKGQDLILNLSVQPKSGKDAFKGLHDNRLKVRITAPPVEGKANAHLVRFLAESFGVPQSNAILVKRVQYQK